MMKRVMIAAVFGATFAPLAAFADASSVAKSCAEIARLGNECSAKDKGIADLVIAIGNESQRVTPAVRQDMASAVDLAGQSVCDVAQQTRINQVAAAMRRNQDTQTAALDSTDTGPAQASGN
jgi:hypothetical protein